ncbi:hypothetical protein [Demequina activiva]|uniref:DUF5666 domain-containing protein n=1 Tax=Demequina activiva TaxID=1582364 RepID=A0A919UH12_9MICO|nr:hypothetical protein [Demequina activiva]GIG55437.1 hypothetical protein Dac01nite_21890 [Demequina activiva]
MRALTVTVATAAAAALAACGADGSTPEREPEAVGTATAADHGGGATRIAFEPDAGYDYFEGTTFVLDEQVSVGGTVTSASAIESGDRLEVWTGPCAESFPVQCTVEHVEVLD